MLKSKGSILAITVGFSLVFTMLGLASIYMSTLQSETQEKQILNQKAFWFAEAGINHAISTILSDSANNRAVPDTFESAQINVTPEGGVKYGWVVVGFPGGVDEIRDFQGIRSFVRTYTITSTGNLNTSPVSVTLTQIVERQKTFVFQYAVFYEDDLEILPGPPMTLTGRIHSNNDIYIGSGDTLTVNSEYLHTAANIYNRRKDTGSLPSLGDVLIRNKETRDYELMKRPSESFALDSSRADWASESQVRWGGTVQSGVHGVTRLDLPSVSSTEPDGYYAANAGLKIVNTTAYFNGTLVTLPGETVTQSTFYDAREGKNVTVTNIDMQKLNESGYFPSNGLIYATRTDASSSEPNGIRLTNGSSLNRGLSVVSNDPVYVQGNYNNVNKKPAAIICDAINILSNNWSDTTSTSSRTADNTEINTAFIAGINPTAGSQYSGGFENYLRFLENWSGKTLTVRGSFVEQGTSQIAQGEWRYGMPYYTAPNRNWDYDSYFNLAANMPPFTPLVVGVVRGAWSQG